MRVSRFLGGFLGLLLTGLVLAGLGWLWLERALDAPGPAAAETVVEVPRGAGLAGIADSLEAAGVVEDALLFRVAARTEGVARQLKAGEYAIPAGASLRAVLGLLARGATLVHRMTVPEGLTSRQVAALIDETESLAGPPVGEDPPPEGSLLPDTYHFSRGDRRADIVTRMRRSMDAEVARLWAERAPDLPLETPEEAVILASIVERETGRGEERARVARVFVNRLERGMRLQSDPTVVFAVSDGAGVLGRKLTRADLAVDSPYNTYQSDGLPPGPIANPGRAALAAVMHPAETDDLYFVADGEGGHRFARTLPEHNRNVRRYRRAQREREAADD